MGEIPPFDGAEASATVGRFIMIGSSSLDLEVAYGFPRGLTFFLLLLFFLSLPLCLLCGVLSGPAA